MDLAYLILAVMAIIGCNQNASDLDLACLLGGLGIKMSYLLTPFLLNSVEVKMVSVCSVSSVGIPLPPQVSEGKFCKVYIAVTYIAVWL